MSPTPKPADQQTAEEAMPAILLATERRRIVRDLVARARDLNHRAVGDRQWAARAERDGFCILGEMYRGRADQLAYERSKIMQEARNV